MLTNRTLLSVSVSICFLLGNSALAEGVATAKAKEESYTIDRSTLQSTEWQRAIAVVTNHPALQKGRGYITLLRVRFEDQEPLADYVEAMLSQAEGQPNEPEAVDRNDNLVVNGVRIVVATAINNELTNPNKRKKPETIQVSSTKLLPLQKGSGGGGMFATIQNGGFVTVEHINSSRRKNNHDPVDIGSANYHFANLMVKVPPVGQLAVLGDVVLKRPKQEELGEIRLNVKDVSGSGVSARRFSVGPLVVGGAYGKTYKFDSANNGIARQMAPGRYKLLLPDFSKKNSRWTIDVKPGQITKLTFKATAQDKVELIGTDYVEIALENLFN